MREREIHEKYVELFNQLKVVIQKTQDRVVSLDPDAFFEENINFLVKSFLMSMCAYLESYLKDIAFSRISRVNQNLLSVSIPYNLVKWDISGSKDFKDKDMKFENLKISTTKKELDEHISGSPYRTEVLFKKIGIDLSKTDDFTRRKDVIQSIVTKRNRIAHHNDDANDISANDLVIYIDQLIEYMNSITRSVESENLK